MLSNPSSNFIYVHDFFIYVRLSTFCFSLNIVSYIPSCTGRVGSRDWVIWALSLAQFCPEGVDGGRKGGGGLDVTNCALVLSSDDELNNGEGLKGLPATANLWPLI